MTVKELAEKLNLEALELPCPEREVCGGYAGDLLSWVMGKANEGDAWVTIMSNINVLAVASLRDVSCVILSENSEIEESILKKAEEEEINILRTAKSTFDICLEIGKFLK